MADDKIFEELKKASARILSLYSALGEKICAAESCTGGLVASSLVSVKGASAVFLGSVVAYCDEAKMNILGVSEYTLYSFFAASPECALEMAEGALKLFRADAAVSTTGFLDANVPHSKPSELAGKVFFASAFRIGNNIRSRSAWLSLDPSAARDENRALAALFALNLLAER